MASYKVAAFEGAPMRKGIVYKIATMTPRKPNSARRTFAKVRVGSNKNEFLQKYQELVSIFYRRIQLLWFVVMGLKILLVLIII